MKSVTKPHALPWRQWLRLGVAVVAFLAFATGADAQIVINFDGLSTGVLDPNQFPEATFTRSTGLDINVISNAANNGGSDPNWIVFLGDSPPFDDLIVDFTNPVTNLIFSVLADTDQGVTGQVDVYENGTLSGTLDVNSAGGNNGTVIDASAFTNVTRVVVHSITDTGGYGYDDFMFAIAVPALPGWGLVILALVMLVGAVSLIYRGRRLPL